MHASEEVLQGTAVVYNQPVLENGIIKIITRGAFHGWLNSPDCNVNWCLDHDESKVVGSLRDGLELFDTDHGLNFRFRFPNTSIGREARSRLHGRRCCVSINFNSPDDTLKEIDGRKLQIVEDARLNEISQVRHGAQKEAFGTLTEPTQSLQIDVLTELSWQWLSRENIKVPISPAMLAKASAEQSIATRNTKPRFAPVAT